MNEIIDRVQSPTPKFFRVLRTIGLSLAAVGGALLSAPVTLPAVVVTAAGYLAVAGTVIGAVSQVTREDMGKGLSFPEVKSRIIRLSSPDVKVDPAL